LLSSSIRVLSLSLALCLKTLGKGKPQGVEITDCRSTQGGLLALPRLPGRICPVPLPLTALPTLGLDLAFWSVCMQP